MDKGVRKLIEQAESQFGVEGVKFILQEGTKALAKSYEEFMHAISDPDGELYSGMLKVAKRFDPEARYVFERGEDGQHFVRFAGELTEEMQAAYLAEFESMAMRWPQFGQHLDSSKLRFTASESPDED